MNDWVQLKYVERGNGRKPIRNLGHLYRNKRLVKVSKEIQVQDI